MRKTNDGIDNTAIVGYPPEDRSWKEGDEMHKPYLGKDVRIGAYVTVDAGKERPTSIGTRTWLMKKVHVGHDARIGPDCELAPGTVVGGGAELGKGVKCGVNATIRPLVKIGDGAVIGCGAVVVKDVEARAVMAGNPARRLEAGHQTDLINGRLPGHEPEEVEALVRTAPSA